MRKILILIFFLFPLLVSADPMPSCTYIDWTSTPDPDPQWTALSTQQYRDSCGSRTFYASGNNVVCARSCSCPSGSTLTKNDITGQSSCVPNSCPEGERVNTVYNGTEWVSSCVTDTPADGGGSSSSPNCTLTETCSSSSASSAPSCPAGQHWDFMFNGQPLVGSTCVPDSRSSSASSASAASAGSSAGSASSSPSSGSNASTPSTTTNLQNPDINIDGNKLGLTSMQSCELTFGVGHCSVIVANSPCPNKFTVEDKSYCVDVSQASNGSGSSAGSGGTGGTGSGEGEGEGEGECDPESSDYLQCATPEGSDTPEHTQTASGLNSVDDINKNFTDRLNNSPIVASLGAIKNIVTLSSASCPDFTIHIFNRDITTTMHCTLWALIAVVLSPIMIAVWSIVAFRIFASA